MSNAWIAGEPFGRFVSVIVDSFPIVTRKPRPARRKGRVNFKALRKKLLEKDPHCKYCRKFLTLETSTADHVIPRSKGGKHDLSNVVLACPECNQKKADKPSL